MWDIYHLYCRLGKAIQVVEKIVEPRAPQLTSQERERRKALFQGHTLYHFRISPFAWRVRRKIAQYGLEIPMRDILEDPHAQEELVSKGGKDQVPCLKIEGTGSPAKWMYESADINDYFKRRLTSQP